MSTVRPTENDVTPHFWVGGFGPVPDRYPENTLAFAERHDITLVLSCWNTTPSDAEQLDTELQLTSNYDVDVWLGTYDLSLRTSEGEWEFVGDVSGYHDGETPYSGGDRDRICTLRALDRDRYLDGGNLGVRTVRPSTESTRCPTSTSHGTRLNRN